MTRDELWIRTLKYVSDQGVPTGKRFRVAKEVFDAMEFLVEPGPSPVEPPTDYRNWPREPMHCPTCNCPAPDLATPKA